MDFGRLDPAADLDDLARRTEAALRREPRAHVPPDEIDEVRILGTWLASHPDTPQLVLRPAPDREALSEVLERARAARSGGEGELDHDGVDLVGADQHV